MKKYDTYKPSGIEWIGEIPSNWEVKKFKYCFDLINEKSDENTPKVGLENIESWTGKFIETNTEYEGDGEEFLINDILYGKLRPYLAKVYLAEFDGKAVGDIFIFRGIKKIKPQYGARLILSKNFIEVTNSATFGSKMPRVSWDFIGNLLLPIPEEKEQLAISNYLDKKTAEIDELIADKRKLLELYEQEKTTIINRAVTKGIDPNAPMKDSGIEWQGEIPKHWEVKKLKYVLKINSGEGIKSEEIKSEGTYPVYGGNGIAGYTEKYNSENNEIIIGRVGAKCGNIRLVSGAKWISDNALVANLVAIVDLKFLSIQMYNMDLNKMANQNAQPLITGTMVKEREAFFPPIEEQKSIIQFIERETFRIDAKETKTKKLIELLTEYRTALISEVVTGKIKVID